jgi:hypothetical protein
LKTPGELQKPAFSSQSPRSIGKPEHHGLLDSFLSPLLQQRAVSADCEQIKQPPQPGVRDGRTHYEQPVYPLKPEARRT